MILRSLVFFACFHASLQAATPNFTPQTIDAEIQIGYGLALGEVDGDRRLDILLADKNDIVWYRNPGSTDGSWTRHVLAHKLTARDNVCIAARDIDGDGLVEVAVGANWNPSETTDIQKSGSLFYLDRPSDPTQRWRPVAITPYDPTTHRMGWICSSDNAFSLVVLPLHGRGNQDGNGDPVRVTAYTRKTVTSSWSVRVLDQSQHMTHNFDVFRDSDSNRDALLVGGREGVVHISAVGSVQKLVANPISRGVGEVRAIRVTAEDEFVTIEPMHGNEVVFYGREADGRFRRVSIDSSLNQGHALAAADLLGMNRHQVVAGWREKDSDGKVGVRLYVPSVSGDEWQRHTVDENQMACEDLRLADLDSDGRIDIVAAGRATRNLVVYWNRTTIGN
jgi:hypothetical protein